MPVRESGPVLELQTVLRLLSVSACVVDSRTASDISDRSEAVRDSWDAKCANSEGIEVLEFLVSCSQYMVTINFCQ